MASEYSVLLNVTIKKIFFYPDNHAINTKGSISYWKGH